MTASADQPHELFCPECGYDLAGIPEDRCPECGFGFQHAAIRSIARAQCGQRFDVYRRVARQSALALGYLSLPAIMILCGRNSIWWGDPLSCGLSLVLLLFTLAPRGGRAAEWRLCAAVTLVLSPILAVAASFAPAIVWGVGVLWLALAALDWLRLPEGFPRAALSVNAESLRRLGRWRIAAGGLFWLAVTELLLLVLATVFL